MSSYRVIIADDHAMFRQGLKKLMQESKELMVIGEADDGLELLEILKNMAPDMVILDISMPKLRGIEATREIKMSYPQVKVLILTMHKRKEYLYHALSAGADGFLLKEDTDKELFSAIAESEAFSVAGGGHTIAGLNKYDLLDKISFVSTSGKAMLLLLMGEYKKLVVLEAFKAYSQD